MASISREIVIRSAAEDVWKVISDFATGPTRMAPGFVVDTRLDGDDRIVTFADGTVVRERLIGIDHDARRIVYSVVGGSVTPEHDNAAMQVIDEGDHCRLTWIRDVLPDTLAAPMAAAMTHGLTVTQNAL
ncbi:SRPBCC family protein [Lentzea sp. NPDC006480]|uniref:SRPBCC family protein n=1 Tax=Lentzea sp. NPDC006480 TaxID=3157176 RepID=UPI0033AA19EC